MNLRNKHFKLEDIHTFISHGSVSLWSPAIVISVLSGFRILLMIVLLVIERLLPGRFVRVRRILLGFGGSEERI